MMNKTRETEVWQRVMAASAEAPACCKPKNANTLTAEQVMELLEDELSVACTYEVLAGRVRGQAQQKLRELARCERRHYGKLEAVYYLMTGKKPCPDRPKPPCVACTTEELRSRYQAEVEGAGRYKCLSERAGSFAKTFLELACEEEHHAQSILQVLQSCL